MLNALFGLDLTDKERERGARSISMRPSTRFIVWSLVAVLGWLVFGAVVYQVPSGTSAYCDVMDVVCECCAQLLESGADLAARQQLLSQLAAFSDKYSVPREHDVGNLFRVRGS